MEVEKKKIFIVVGTRPEVIKMAPVIKLLLRQSWCEVKVVATAQHREMLDQALETFEISIDYDFNLMSQGQTLTKLTVKILESFDQLFSELRPDLVIVHGDTTTSSIAALSCFYSGIDVAHVEAGLRTQDIRSPFPEELNRQLTARIAAYHFAPTVAAAENLRMENIPSEKIYITGNTVVDAVKMINEKIEQSPMLKNMLEDKYGYINDYKKLVLVTVHRRENFGSPLIEIFEGIKSFAIDNPDTILVFPVHPNPMVQKVAFELLNEVSNIKLSPPMDYLDFVFLMKQCELILTDSGGIQEESTYFAKKVIILRNQTERKEVVSSGRAVIVKLERVYITRAITSSLSTIDAQHEKLSLIYGAGDAAEKIVKQLAQDMHQ